MALMNPRQKNVVGKGMAAANDVLQILEPLEKFAAMVPEYAQRVADLRTKRDALYHVCDSLIKVDAMSEG